MKHFKGIFSQGSLGLQLVVFILLSFLFATFGQLLLFGFFADNTRLTNLWAAQAVATTFTFLLPALCTAYLLQNPDGKTFLRIRFLPDGKQIGLALLAYFALVPLINFTTVWNQSLSLPESMVKLENYLRRMEDLAAIQTELFFVSSSIKSLIINLLLLGIMTAICEELFFRGILQRILSNKLNLHLSVWLTAFIFSALHLQFFGFVPRMLLGAFLGYLFAWSGSLWLPIIIHFTNNASIVLLKYLTMRSNNTIEMSDLNNIGTNEQWWLAVISLIAGAGFLFLLYKNRKNDYETV